MASKLTETDGTEGDLIASMRQGREEAFERVVREYGSRMLSVARRYLPNEDDANEAVQDAFLSAFRSLDQFEGNAKLETWLHRITVNASLMKLRAKRRRTETQIEELLPKFVADGHMATPTRDWSAMLADSIDEEESRSAIRAAIERLPDAYRLVLVMRDVEQLSTEQSAELLGVSTDAVKTRLHRARQALRGLLEAHFGGPER